MQKKMKLQQILIVFLAVVISLLFITLLAGRNDRVSILVVASDKLDTNAKLDGQISYFEEKKISKDDMEAFGEGALVTNVSQLQGKYLRFELPVGVPVPTSFLSDEKKSGAFAAEMTKYHTVFNFVEGKAALPPDVQPGDKIDIMLTLQPKTKEEGLITGPLLTGVTVMSIGETDVSVMVTQKQYNQLALAKEIGTFVLQLPGQKEDSLNCSDVDKDKAASVVCYTELDKPTTIGEFELRDFVRENAALNGTVGKLTQELEEVYSEESGSEETVAEESEDGE